MRQSVCRLILFPLLLAEISLGGDGWQEARTHALFDSEQEGLALVETVNFKTARAIRRTFQEWKDLVRRGGEVSPYDLIFADYGSFMSVVLYNDLDGITLFGEPNIFSRQSDVLYFDCKTFLPITRHEAWEREVDTLNKCFDKNAEGGRRNGIDNNVEEPLMPITQIIDDIDIARVISIAVRDWDEQNHSGKESSVTLWVAEHESYYCVSFIDMENVDEKGVPLRGVHHSYIDSETYCLVSREVAKRSR